MASTDLRQQRQNLSLAPCFFLAQISRSKLENCVFSGGIDSAWLAAVAEFAFDFTVEIINQEGDCEYHSVTEYRSQNDKAQVIFLKNVEAGESTKITQKCFRLPNGRSLLNGLNLTAHESQSLEFEARSPWTKIIGDSFGTAAQDLLHTPVKQDFAMLLIYVARRPLNFGTEELFPNDCEQWRWPDMCYGPQNRRSDELLIFAAKQLPELQPCLEVVDFRRMSKITEEDAVSCFQAIYKACGCSAYLRHEDMNDGVCLGRLAAAIIEYIKILSMASIQGVLPTPLGLRRLYLSTIGQGFSSKQFEPLYLVQSGFWLFSPTGAFSVGLNNGKPALALSGGGICCIYRLLIDLATQPALAPMVHVMPGQLTYEGSLFEVIEDLRLGEKALSAWTFQSRRKYNLYLAETIDSKLLKVAYQSQSDSTGTSCIFSPKHILLGAFERRQHSGRRCENQNTVLRFFEGVNITAEGTSYLESWWKFCITDPPEEWDANVTFCQLHADLPSRLSLVIIMSDPSASPQLEIHKSSTRYWDQPCFNVEQLYAGYAYKLSGSNGQHVQIEVAEVSDCPNCIMAFVSSVWHCHPDGKLFFSTLSTNVVSSRLRLYLNDQLTATINFELRSHSKNSEPLILNIDPLGNKKPSPPVGMPQNSKLGSLISLASQRFKNERRAKKSA